MKYYPSWDLVQETVEKHHSGLLEDCLIVEHTVVYLHEAVSQSTVEVSETCAYHILLPDGIPKAYAHDIIPFPAGLPPPEFPEWGSWRRI